MQRGLPGEFDQMARLTRFLQTNDHLKVIWRIGSVPTCRHSLLVSKAIHAVQLSDHSLVKEIARIETLSKIAASVSAAASIAGTAAQAVASVAVARAVRPREASKSDFYYLYEMSRASKRF